MGQRLFTLRMASSGAAILECRIGANDADGPRRSRVAAPEDGRAPGPLQKASDKREIRRIPAKEHKQPFRVVSVLRGFLGILLRTREARLAFQTQIIITSVSNKKGCRPQAAPHACEETLKTGFYFSPNWNWMVEPSIRVMR